MSSGAMNRSECFFRVGVRCPYKIIGEDFFLAASKGPSALRFFGIDPCDSGVVSNCREF